jgi:hypothetical protein
MDALRWTPSMNVSLEKLDRAPECPGDQLLVNLVRLQHINQRTITSSWYDLNMAGSLHSAGTSALIAQAMLTQLEHLVESMPPNMQQHSRS